VKETDKKLDSDIPKADSKGGEQQTKILPKNTDKENVVRQVAKSEQ